MFTYVVDTFGGESINSLRPAMSQHKYLDSERDARRLLKSEGGSMTKYRETKEGRIPLWIFSQYGRRKAKVLYRGKRGNFTKRSLECPDYVR